MEEDVEEATENIRRHDFFASIDFEQLREGALESPYDPKVKNITYINTY